MFLCVLNALLPTFLGTDLPSFYKESEIEPFYKWMDATL